MKYPLLFILFFLKLVSAKSQSTFVANPYENYGACTTGVLNGSCSFSYTGGVIRFKASAINTPNSTVVFTVSKCIGQSATFGTGAEYYIKESTSSTSANVVCGTSTNVGIITGQTEASYTYSLTHSTSTRYYCAVVISGGVRYYSNTISVTATPNCNLIISSISVNPTTILAGNTTNVTTEIANSGNANSQSCSIGYYLSSNTTLDIGSDPRIGETNISSINSNSTSNFTQTLTIPPTIPASNYYIIARVDDYLAVSEFNENDNTRFTYVNVTVPQLPDLLINSVSINPTQVLVGNTINVSTIVSNAGGSLALPTQLMYYLSTDNINNNGNDIFLPSTQNIPQLAAGQQHTNITTLTIPASTIPASYFIFARCDANANVIETNENNNFNSTPLVVNGNNILCNILNSGSISTEAYNATCYLIQQSILDNNQDGIFNRDNPIIRQDVAKVSYKGLFNGEPTNPAMNFPTPFLDLQTTNSYHKYALALSYLEFTDNVSPFSRSFISFNPTGNITRVNTLKVLLESFNINETNYANVVVPYNDVSNLNSADLNYVKAAYQLGIISNQSLFNPTTFIKRQDAFIMLHRLLTNNNITKPTAIELQNIVNYFLPSNITPFNANNAKGLAEGNFTYYGTSSFNIPDKGGFSLSFDHSYYSALTEIQDTLIPNEMEIFGRGWTHNYFNYIIGIDNIKLEGDPVLKNYLFNVSQDGTYDVYNNIGNPTSPTSVTKGNYNKLLRINTTTFEITTKAQVKLTYKKQTATSNVYVLTEVKDRNDNKLILSYIANTNKLEYVTAPSGRFIKLVYSGNTVRVEYPLNRVLTFNIPNGRLANYKQNNNIHFTTYDYEKLNQPNLLTKIVLPKGNSVLNDYTTSGKLKFSTTNNINNAETKVTVTPPSNYDVLQQSEAQVQYENNQNYIQKYFFNNAGLPYRIEANTDWANFQYGDVNHPTIPTQINNSANATVKFENLDNYGNPRLITTPMGFTEKFTYNTDGTIDTYIDKMNRLYSFEYWAGNRGNLKFLVMPYEGGIRRNQYAYNTDGSVQFNINPEGIVTNYEYNTYGNLTKVIQPAINITTETKYDAASRPYEIIDGRGNKTLLEYDVNDNTKKITDANLEETKLEVDDNNNLSNIINAKGDTTKLRYDYKD
jgi:YD repeat-containing protein